MCAVLVCDEWSRTEPLRSEEASLRHTGGYAGARGASVSDSRCPGFRSSVPRCPIRVTRPATRKLCGSALVHSEKYCRLPLDRFARVPRNNHFVVSSQSLRHASRFSNSLARCLSGSPQYSVRCRFASQRLRTDWSHRHRLPRVGRSPTLRSGTRPRLE